MITYIVLAAGMSARFKSPKALSQIENQNCITYLLNKIIPCAINEIILVLGAHASLIQPTLFKHNLIRVVHNKDHILGQTSSVIAALKSSDPRSTAFALHPVDCPFVEKKTIDDLINQFFQEKPDIQIPCYRSKKGHPPIFNTKIKNIILGLNPAIGINTAFNAHDHRIELIETADPGITQSFNTAEELNLILNNRRKSVT